MSAPPPYQAIASADERPHNHSDIPDDFKYSTTIVSCDFEVRQQFMAKVYSILSTQLLCTLIFCYLTIKSPKVQLFLIKHTGLYIVAAITTLVSCIWLALSPRPEEYEGPAPWYSLQGRTQYALLGLFTVAESYCMAGCVMFESLEIVLSALVVTFVVVVGVSLMAFSGKFQIALESATSIYYWLNLAVLLLIGVGLSAIFVGGMNSTVSILYGWLGAVVFSIYLFIDTQLIFRKMYLGEEVRCAMMLYLDIVNLFLSILRILSSQNGDD